MIQTLVLVEEDTSFPAKKKGSRVKGSQGKHNTYNF